jgi:hypothetical protein
MDGAAPHDFESRSDCHSPGTHQRKTARGAFCVGMSRARNALPSQRRGVIGASGPPDASKRARLGPQPPDCKRAGLAPSAAQRGSRGRWCVIGQFAAGGIRVRRQFTFGKWMTRGNTSAFLCIRCRRHAPVASVPRVTEAFLCEGKCARRLFCIAYYWLAIATRSATHAADCVFTQFSASRPALNLYTGSIVPSGHSASTSQCSPSLRITENIGVRAVTFSPTHT